VKTTRARAQARGERGETRGRNEGHEERAATGSAEADTPDGGVRTRA